MSPCLHSLLFQQKVRGASLWTQKERTEARQSKSTDPQKRLPETRVRRLRTPRGITIRRTVRETLIDLTFRVCRNGSGRKRVATPVLFWPSRSCARSKAPHSPEKDRLLCRLYLGARGAAKRGRMRTRARAPTSCQKSGRRQGGKGRGKKHCVVGEAPRWRVLPCARSAGPERRADAPNMRLDEATTRLRA